MLHIFIVLFYNQNVAGVVLGSSLRSLRIIFLTGQSIIIS